ncbi:PEP-CTERM sorting domain-containing protein [Oceaniferula spumae]
MKPIPHILTAVALTLGSASAATIATTVNVTNDATGTLVIASSFGGSGSASNPGIPVNSSSAVNTQTYTVTLNNLDLSAEFAGATDIDIAFNLSLTASAGDGLIVNGGSPPTGAKGWVVDNASNGGGTDITRLESGETITFAISGFTVLGTSGGTGGLDGSNFSFDSWAATANFNVNPANSDWNSASGIASGTVSGTNGTRLNGIGFNIIAVPEPSSTVLLGLAGLTMILRRRR